MREIKLEENITHFTIIMFYDDSRRGERGRRKGYGR